MQPSLPIIDVAVAGLGRAIWASPRLLAIYCLPWLLGTIALILLDVVLQDHLRLGWAPQWARSLVWAPFAGMAYALLLRWALCEQAPVRAIEFDTSRETAFAAPILAAWLVTMDALDAAPTPILLWLAVPDPSAFRWDDVAPLSHALRAAAWLTNVALGPCFFGLIVVVTKCGWPDFRKLWRLLRLRPIHLFGVALLADAAAGGAQGLYTHAQAWLGLNRLTPIDMIPWRANIHWAFASELAQFPFSFAGFAIEGCILAEAYRRLLQVAAGDRRQAAPAP